MTSSTTTAPSAARPEHRGRRRLAVLGLAALAGLLTWAVAVPLLGVDLIARTGETATTVGPVSIVVAAAVIAGAGWLSLALLERLTVHGRRVWTVIAGTVLVLSLLGPLGGVGGGAIAGLVALHLVVGLITIIGLRGRARG